MASIEAEKEASEAPKRATLTWDEVAALYDIHRNTVYEWARTGRIPTIPSGGYKVIFPRAAIMRHLGLEP